MEFQEFILKQLRPTHGGSLYEQWLLITQCSIVADYRKQFIETADSLDGVIKSILLGHYVNDLKEEKRAEVRLLSPLNLD